MSIKKELRYGFIILIFIFILIIALNLVSNTPEEISDNVNIVMGDSDVHNFTTELESLARIGIEDVVIKEYEGPWVSELQIALRALGITDLKNRNLTVDGSFGPQTMYALEQYAKANNLTLWIINLELVNHISESVNSVGIDMELKELFKIAGEEIPYNYEYTDQGEIKELQETLNKINSDGSQIGTNGNYDYITANRLLQFKKAYNSQESVSPKLKEDNSLDRDTLDALKKTKEVHNLTKIKGITWEKPFKQKVSDFFYINFKKPLKNTPEH